MTWLVQFFLKLRYNVLMREDRHKGEGQNQTRLWTSTGKAALGHSFWLIVIACGLFVLNVTILALLEQKRKRRLRSMGGLVGLGVGGGVAQNIYSSGMGGSGGGGGMGVGGGGSVIGSSKKQHIMMSDAKPNGNLMLY